MKKIYYVHIPKTGGISIKKILRQKFEGHCSSKIVPLGHGTLRDAIDYGVDIKNLYTFSVVRNPWDRIHSFFHFYKHGTVSGLLPTSFTKWFLYSEDFNTHIHYVDWKEDLRHPMYWPQTKWLMDYQGKLAVDTIVSYPDLGEFMVDLGNRYVPDVYVDTHVYENETFHKDQPYLEEYTEESKRIVADMFREDIETFGFTFEGGYVDGRSEEDKFFSV